MLGAILMLPFAPVRGTLALARLLQAQAERELYDPSVAWRRLAEAEEEAAAGRLSPAELAERQREILDQLTN